MSVPVRLSNASNELRPSSSGTQPREAPLLVRFSTLRSSAHSALAAQSPPLPPPAPPMSKPAAAASAAAPNRGPARDDSDDDDSGAPAANAGPYRTDPKGDALVAEAEKKLKSFSLFGYNATQKQEDAKELLEKAAAQYKLNKNWSECERANPQEPHAKAGTTNTADERGRWRRTPRRRRQIFFSILPLRRSSHTSRASLRERSHRGRVPNRAPLDAWNPSDESCRSLDHSRSHRALTAQTASDLQSSTPDR